MEPNKYQAVMRRGFELNSPRPFTRNSTLCLCAMGLCGESVEFEAEVRERDNLDEMGAGAAAIDEVNRRISTEAGDVLWYVSLLASLIGSKMSFIVDSANGVVVSRGRDRPAYASGRIADAIKKVVFHGSLLTYDVHTNISTDLINIAARLKMECGDFAPIMAANLRKLQARYPHSYPAAMLAEHGVTA